MCYPWKVNRSRGMVLIVSLLLVMTIVVIGRAAIALNPGLLSLESSSASHEQARRAAESGLEYALQRLREEPTWRGDGNQVVVDLPHLYVEEKDGNVVGLLLPPGGEVSQFRIRFNFQDGSPGADNLPDPPSGFWLDHPWVCYNNAAGSSAVARPVGDGSNFSVDDPEAGPEQIPGHSVFVAIEGRCGPGLRDHTSAAANAAPSGRVSVAVLEASLTNRLDQDVPTAALMAGGDISLTVPSSSEVFLTIYGQQESDQPRIRSKGSIQVTDTTGAPGALRVGKMQGEIGRNASAAPGFLGSLIGQGATLEDEYVGDGLDFYNLSWDDVAKASSDPNESIHIPAGTYVMWASDEKVHYYDMGFEDYQTYMTDPANQTDPGTVLSWGLPEIRDPDNYAQNSRIVVWKEPNDTLSLGFEKDTFIEPSPSGVTDFTVTSRRGAVFSPTDSSDFIAANDDGWDHSNAQVRVNGCTVSAPGDVRLLSNLVGNSATITTEGEFTLVTSYGRMQDSADPDISEGGLNLYAKGDINISTYRDRSGDFGTMSFRGLIYSWGDFTSLTGHPDVPVENWRESVFGGAVVAYGSDPESGSPGSSGNGKMDLVGAPINLWNHVDQVTGALDLSQAAAPVRLVRTSYSLR